MSRRRRRASATEAQATEAADAETIDGAANEADESTGTEPALTEAQATEAADVVDVSEPDVPSLEWVNRSGDDVRIELCSLDSSVVHNLSIAPGQRLRAPAVYADMVRMRAPQMHLEG